MTTAYRKLNVETAAAMLKYAGLKWQAIGIAPYDTSLAWFNAIVPEHIADKAKYVGNRLERTGMVMTIFQIPERRAWFRLKDTDHE